MATQVRPLTPNMRNALPSSWNSSSLSPQERQVPIHPGAAGGDRLGAVELLGRGRVGNRRGRAQQAGAPIARKATPAASMARSERGAWASGAKRHQSSWEYSTWR